MGNFYTKMGDFIIMTQNSILINFGMKFIIEIVYFEFLLLNFENFIPYKYYKKRFLNKSIIWIIRAF